ncbi:MAG TPA: hypothetical protein VHL59_05105 [Thermoanaerobaculia bacterium]|nr:hypothetical protein [Thermoanaerobaculia bacterium]
MDQDNPNTGWNNTSGTGGSSTGSGSMGGGSMGGGSTTGGTGGGFDTAGNVSSGSFGTTSATDSGICPHCGQSMNRAGLEQFLGRLGINEDMINNLKSQFQNVDIDEYLNTARDYLKNTGNKASSYTKENPGKVAAGVAALALGAGLIYAAVNRDKS